MSRPVLRIAPRTETGASQEKPDPEFVKTVLAMMRAFHYVVGITAPDKKHEKQILFVWIGLFFGLISLGLLFAWFIIPHVFK
jgi:hypothetical protein